MHAPPAAGVLLTLSLFRCNGADNAVQMCVNSQSVEIANVLIGVSTLGRRFMLKDRLACLTDNSANVSLFARGRTSGKPTRNGAFITDCIRDIVQYGIVDHSEIRLLHVPRDKIPDADDSSRGLIDKFRSRNPDLVEIVPVIPHRFQILNGGHICLGRCRSI